MRQSLNQFPLKIDQWTGTRKKMEQVFIDDLDFTDYIMIEYQNSRKKTVNLYVAYYDSQRKGESIHSPETCSPGSGWIFTEAGERSIFVSGKSHMTVNRTVMEKNALKQLAYYWFPQQGRILTNSYQLKFFNFLDALTKAEDRRRWCG